MPPFYWCPVGLVEQYFAAGDVHIRGDHATE